MYTAAVITVSDMGFRGEREDTSGPNLQRILRENDFEVVYTAMVPDEAEAIRRELLKCADELHIALISPPAARAFPHGTLRRRPP